MIRRHSAKIYEKPSELLKDARTLISDEAAWTQGVIAKTKEGQIVDVYSSEGECFCLYGALLHTAGLDVGRNQYLLGDIQKTMNTDMALLSRKMIGGAAFIAYNDNGEATHGDIIALMDRSLVRLEAEGK